MQLLMLAVVRCCSVCQSCSVLFHNRGTSFILQTNTTQRKWKWTDKSDIWPPCSIQKMRWDICRILFFRLRMPFFPIRGCFWQMFKKQISKHSSKQIFWHSFCLSKTPPSRFLLFSPSCLFIFFYFFFIYRFFRSLESFMPNFTCVGWQLTEK